jgi:hypothetical protein
MRGCAVDEKPETAVQFMIKVSCSTNGDKEDYLTMATSFFSFEYICQFNNCNDQLSEKKLKKVVDDHLQHVSPQHLSMNKQRVNHPILQSYILYP